MSGRFYCAQSPPSITPQPDDGCGMQVAKEWLRANPAGVVSAMSNDAAVRREILSVLEQGSQGWWEDDVNDTLVERSPSSSTSSTDRRDTARGIQLAWIDFLTLASPNSLLVHSFFSSFAEEAAILANARHFAVQDDYLILSGDCRLVACGSSHPGPAALLRPGVCGFEAWEWCGGPLSEEDEPSAAALAGERRPDIEASIGIRNIVSFRREPMDDATRCRESWPDSLH